MNITVLAPAYYQNLYPVRYLDQSAKRHGIDVHWYGLGKPYPGWYDVQIIDLLEELAEVTTSHVLYTDASDAIFLAGLDEIENKYEVLGCPPILISRELSGVCAGGILARTAALINGLEILRVHCPLGDDPHNPQVRWRAAIAQEIVYAKIDEESDIFQVGDEPLNVIEAFPENKTRVYNLRTRSVPSLIHFAGGYSHQQYGKRDIILPTWQKLYPDVDIENLGR